MVALYSGNIIAFVAVHKQNLPIRNLEDLAAHPGYQAGVLPGSSGESFFRVGFPSTLVTFLFWCSVKVL